MVLNFQAKQDVQFQTKCFWLSVKSYYWATPSRFFREFYTSVEITYLSFFPVIWNLSSWGVSFLLHSFVSNMRSALPPTTSLLHESEQWSLQPEREGGKYIGWEFQERVWEGERQIVLHYSSRLLSDTNTGTPVRSVWESRTTRGFCQWNKQRQGRLDRVMFTLGDAREDWKQMYTVGISCSR